MTLLTNRTQEPIPGYRTVRRIGAGGYGEVWAAQAPGDLNKAIKFVYGLLDEDRAARELKALNRIKGVRHPFLLSLERIEIVDGQLLIVTELADSSLKDRFEECRAQGLPGIPRDELLRHLRDAADALDYMSDQHSLQHLDVKPENLLLLGGRIKVADFGLVKDIHDHTASMMGGLTPVYAPPEVFEGRPSRRSDQYSLAILYQEMLTAALPFPGRTAAQLAAQHLNAKPRLTALPAEDQPAIARALSKKPEDRFTRCGDLVDALLAAGKLTAAREASGNAGRPAADGAVASLSATQANSRTPDDMLANLDAAARAAELAATGLLGQPTQPPGQAQPPHPTLAPGDVEAGDSGEASPASAASGEAAPSLATLETPPSLVDLPPVQAPPPAQAVRPTLFIGLGGCGGKVLRRLRRRLADRQSTQHRGLLSMLLLDSDSRELAAASHGDEAGQLKPEETVALPLRRSQDYRTDSRRILEWLSRRWLYNIPRSQQTEGLRPLGRLALADHAELAIGKLRRAIEAVHVQATHMGAAPRVIICGSLCGGAGGGMLADVVMAVRQMLDELQANNSETLAVLTFSTNRNPQQQELAAASGLATLTELAQFHREGAVYPGDAACGLKERPAAAGGLDAAYVFHAGQELSQHQWDAACDRIAEFLLLETITPVGHALAAARQESPPSTGLKIRSFGLYQVGFAQDRLVDESIRRVCRETISRWNGLTQKPESKKPARLLHPTSVRESTAAAPPATPLTPSDLDARAAEQAQSLGLDAEPLVQAAAQMATAEMGGDSDRFFRNLMITGNNACDPATLAQWLSAANELFGRPQFDPSVKAQDGELAQALDERIKPAVAQLGAQIKTALETFVDLPQSRLLGAKRAAKWLQAHLKSLVERLRETRMRLVQEWAGFEQALNPQQLDPRLKTKTPRRTPEELAGLFLQYCRLRLFELATDRAANMAHALQSHAGAAHDGLVELTRELDHLASQFSAEETLACSASSTALDFCSLREAVIEQMRCAEDALAAQIDQQLTQSVFTPQGGMRAVISAGGEARELLVTILRTTARQAVLTKLQTIDLASLLLSEASADSPLRNCLIDAQPWLQICGGRRRLWCVIPEQLADQYSPATLAAQLGPNVFRQLPGVVPDAASDLVLLYELGDLSLPHVAARLIDFRPDLIDAAARLHTRSDVTWTPLLS